MLVGHNGSIVLLPCTFLCNSASDNNSAPRIQAEAECFIFMSSHLMKANTKKSYTLENRCSDKYFLLPLTLKKQSQASFW